MGHDMGMDYVFKEFAKDRSDGDGVVFFSFVCVTFFKCGDDICFCQSEGFPCWMEAWNRRFTAGENSAAISLSTSAISLRISSGPVALYGFCQQFANPVDSYSDVWEWRMWAWTHIGERSSGSCVKTNANWLFGVSVWILLSLYVWPYLLSVETPILSLRFDLM